MKREKVDLIKNELGVSINILNIMKITLCIILSSLFCYFNTNLYPQSTLSINTFINENEKKRVLSNEIITEASLVYDENLEKRKLSVPKTSFSDHDFSPYEMLVTEKAFIPFKLTRSSKLKLYNILASYSKLSCVSYYSVTDKVVKPFILKSCRIKSNSERVPVEDIIDKSIIRKKNGYFQIEDNRFGEMTFKSEIHNERDNFIIKNICIDELGKFGFTITNNGEYRFLFYFIYDHEAKGYFYYAVQAIRIRSWYIRKLGLITEESFSNRLRAMTVYYVNQLGLDWNDKLKACE